MFSRIALLAGLLCVPVLLALASQALTATEAPDVRDSRVPPVATAPPVKPALPTARAALTGVPAPDSEPGPGPESPVLSPGTPTKAGTHADLDGDNDDDGIPDTEEGS